MGENLYFTNEQKILSCVKTRSCSTQNIPVRYLNTLFSNMIIIRWDHSLKYFCANVTILQSNSKHVELFTVQLPRNVKVLKL